MITPVYGQDAVVSAFVGSFIPGGDRGFGPCSTIGFARDGAIVAGVIYHNWNPESGVIEMSAGATCRDWASRDAIKRIFAFPFLQLDCHTVVARISERNKRARRVWRGLGAVEHKIPRLRGPDEAEIIATIARDDWLSGPYAKDLNNGKIEGS